MELQSVARVATFLSASCLLVACGSFYPRYSPEIGYGTGKDEVLKILGKPDVEESWGSETGFSYYMKAGQKVSKYDLRTLNDRECSLHYFLFDKNDRLKSWDKQSCIPMALD